jgi:hypothetical protein
LALTLQAACTTPPPPATVELPTPATDTSIYQEIPTNQESIPSESTIASEMMADIRWKCHEATQYLSCSHDALALFFEIRKKYPITVGACVDDLSLTCQDRLLNDRRVAFDATAELYIDLRNKCNFAFEQCVKDETARGTEWYSYPSKQTLLQFLKNIKQLWQFLNPSKYINIKVLLY